MSVEDCPITVACKDRLQYVQNQQDAIKDADIEKHGLKSVPAKPFKLQLNKAGTMLLDIAAASST